MTHNEIAIYNAACAALVIFGFVLIIDGIIRYIRIRKIIEETRKK